MTKGCVGSLRSPRLRGEIKELPCAKTSDPIPAIRYALFTVA